MKSKWLMIVKLFLQSLLQVATDSNEWRPDLLPGGYRRGSVPAARRRLGEEQCRTCVYRVTETLVEPELHKYRANIELGEKKLSLGDRGCILPLVEANQPKQKDNPCVRALETIQIPPCSEMEVMACLEEPPGDGTWLMEGTQEKRVPALVARALVNANTSRVPVRILNPRVEPVQLFKGTEVTVLELVDISGEVVISNVGSDTISQEKREMLRGLAETQGAGLTMEQREQFYSLLLTYADILQAPTVTWGGQTS